MPIVTVECSNWVNKPALVDDFIDDLQALLRDAAIEFDHERAENILQFVKTRRAYTYRMRWWLDALEDRASEQGSFGDPDFWGEPVLFGE